MLLIPDMAFLSIGLFSIDVSAECGDRLSSEYMAGAIYSCKLNVL